MRTVFSAAGLLCAAGRAVAARETAAVFDVQISNFSPVPGDEANRARLERTSDQLRDLLRKMGLSVVAPTDPVKDEVAWSARPTPLQRLRRCLRPQARRRHRDHRGGREGFEPDLEPECLCRAGFRKRSGERL